MEYIALIPTKNNRDTICNVINDALEYYSKVVVVPNGSTDGTPNILRKYKGNENVDIIGSKPGKGNAVYQGIIHINEMYNGCYKFISTIDADSEMLVQDALNVIKTAQNYAEPVAFGKGYRYNNFEDMSRISKLAYMLLEDYINRNNIKSEPIKDPRSGHHAITPIFADIIENKGISSMGYGLELNLITLAYESKMNILQTKVTQDQENSRYGRNDIPLNDLREYQKLFGETTVQNALEELIGSENLVLRESNIQLGELESKLEKL